VRQKTFDEMMRAAAESWLLDIEGAKIDFALELNKLMERKEISRSDLASRLGVSLPMITKILRGDTNLTIETMVRATRAAKGRLRVEVVPEDVVEASKSEPWLETAGSDPVLSWRAISKREPSGDAGLHGWLRVPKAGTKILMQASNDYEDEPLAA
jgi:transcriptional regulator with XRE-family HTH domain